MFQVFQDEFHVDMSTNQWLLIVFPPVLLTCFMRSLRAITLISFTGGVLVLVFVGSVTHYLLFQADHIPLAQLPLVTNFTGVMAALGSVLYSFHGQPMVLTLENRLRDPKKMGGPLGVLSTSMSAVTLIYLAVGLSGYLTYGSGVAGSRCGRGRRIYIGQ